MRAVTTLTIFVLTAFLATTTFDIPAADARPRVAKSAGKNFSKSVRRTTKGVSRSVRSVGRGVGRSARRGARTIWVGTGIGAGAAAVTRNCNYYYQRYQETRHAKWRNKYNACIR